MNHTIKQVTSFAATVLLTASITLPAFSAQFTDVPSGNWAQHAISHLTGQGILTGYPDGEFRPEGPISRAEFAAMLVKALHLDNGAPFNGTNFEDVPPTFWAYRPIELVSEKGLVSGYPGGVFMPNKSISRVEAMAILVNAAHVSLPSQGEAVEILKNYTDGYNVPQWGQRAVAGAIQSGIFVNYPSQNLIEPNQAATRAEVAVMADHFESFLAHGAPQNESTMGQKHNHFARNSRSNRQEAYNTNDTPQQGNMIHGHVSVVPTNTVFTGVDVTPVSSDRSQIGDPITVTLNRPILSPSGNIVIPQDSQVHGVISRIEPPGHGEKNASMAFDFNRITTPDGRTFYISAEVNGPSGALVGGSTKGRVLKVAGRTLGGAAIGGAAGALIGGIAKKGRADEGLLWGGLLGSTLGAASAVVAKGQPVVVNPGEVLEIRLRQPLAVSSS